MTLLDLHASFTHDPKSGLTLIMRCPLNCGKHGVGIPVSVGIVVPGRWTVNSMDLNTLTVEPSILHSWLEKTPSEDRCPYHFKVQNGQVTLA